AMPGRSPGGWARTCSRAVPCRRCCRCDMTPTDSEERITMTQIAFAPDVFTWPADQPQLIGGRCAACAAVAFPLPSSCARCGSTEVERHLLPRRGTLYTWTTQDFLPKEPYASGETLETFRPYGVGLVQL